MRTSFSSRRAASRPRPGSTSIAWPSRTREAAGRDADAGADVIVPIRRRARAHRGPGQRRRHLSECRGLRCPGHPRRPRLLRSVLSQGDSHLSGATCVVPHASMESWPDSLDQLKAAGFLLVATTLAADAVLTVEFANSTQARGRVAVPSAPRDTACRTRRSTTPTCACGFRCRAHSTRSTSRPRRGSFCSGSARHPWSPAAVPVRSICHDEAAEFATLHVVTRCRFCLLISADRRWHRCRRGAREIDGLKLTMTEKNCER